MATSYKEATAFECRMQPFMDQWYSKRGWKPDRTKAGYSYDLSLTRRNKTHHIEEKYNLSEEYDQGIIEIVQDVPSGHSGWFVYTKCDYLHFIYCGHDHKTARPLVFYRIHWAPFKLWLVSYMKENKWIGCNFCATVTGITVNVPVKWAEIAEYATRHEVVDNGGLHYEYEIS